VTCRSDGRDDGGWAGVKLCCVPEMVPENAVVYRTTFPEQATDEARVCSVPPPCETVSATPPESVIDVIENASIDTGPSAVGTEATPS